jgi:hypothetical protein
MSAEATADASRPATIRSAVSNGTRLLAGVDGRLSTARRFRDLIAELTAEAGDAEGLSAAERSAIRQAATIMLRAEQLQSAIVKGEAVDSDTLIRLSSEARRVLAGLRRRVRTPKTPTFREMLTSRAARHGGAALESKT